ncbi:hypothetical protein CK203_008766 [Vitis vinifera]|uniref:Uncharacterized protein n=1 Tax=Vitis vinifera TaxID=29760 RepID=A0A438KDP3_VITVI|nr:hypothetical protein CK203_008766 [Vitis vinifera]
MEPHKSRDIHPPVSLPSGSYNSTPNLFYTSLPFSDSPLYSFPWFLRDLYRGIAQAPLELDFSGYRSGGTFEAETKDVILRVGVLWDPSVEKSGFCRFELELKQERMGRRAWALIWVLGLAMDDREMVDAATLDPELLQLQEVSSFAVKASPQLADELFAQWLSLPDTGRLVYCSGTENGKVEGKIAL